MLEALTQLLWFVIEEFVIIYPPLVQSLYDIHIFTPLSDTLPDIKILESPNKVTHSNLRK